MLPIKTVIEYHCILDCRLDMELEMRQRDSQDVLNGENGLFEDILGPELDDEYDNDDTGLSGGSGMSQGRLLVIDKSVNIQPGTV